MPLHKLGNAQKNRSRKSTRSALLNNEHNPSHRNQGGSQLSELSIGSDHRRHSLSTDEGDDNDEDSAGSLTTTLSGRVVDSTPTSRSRSTSTPTASTPTASTPTASTPSTPRSRPGPRTKNPLRSNKRGIQEPTQAEILETIEEQHGIKGLLASELGVAGFCAEQGNLGYTDIYGQDKTTARNSVYNKIRNWCRLSDEAYQNLLLHFKIIPHEFRAGKTLKDKIQPDAVPSKLSSPTPSNLSSPIPSKPKSRTSHKRSSPAPPKPKQQLLSPTPKAKLDFVTYREPAKTIDSSDDEDEKMSVQTFTETKGFKWNKAYDAIELPVDNHNPYALGLFGLEITLLKGYDDKEAKGEFNGWECRMSADSRDFMHKRIHAKIVSSNMVLITKPLSRASTQSAVDVKQADAFEDKSDAAIIRGREVARVQFENLSPSEQEARLLLVFPEFPGDTVIDSKTGTVLPTKISNTVFQGTASAGNKDNVELEVCPTVSFSGVLDGKGEKLKQVTSTASWKFINESTRRPYGAKAKSKSTFSLPVANFNDLDLDEDVGPSLAENRGLPKVDSQEKSSDSSSVSSNRSAQMSVSSSFTGSPSKKLDQTIEAAKDDLNEGRDLLDSLGKQDDDTVMGGENHHKKRSIEDSNKRSSEVNLITYASMEDSIHIISKLTEEDQMRLNQMPKIARDHAVNKYLGGLYNGLPQLQQFEVDQEETNLGRFNVLMACLGFNNEQK